jgi:multiple sugar transport system ATP-binding protein
MNLIEGPRRETRRATIGIRPEHIDVGTEGSRGAGTVGVSEHLGSDTFFHVHATGLADR